MQLGCWITGGIVSNLDNIWSDAEIWYTRMEMTVSLFEAQRSRGLDKSPDTYKENENTSTATHGHGQGHENK